MGYDVKLSAPDSRDFGHLLNLFKMAVDNNCRQYDAARRVWYVEKRAARSLETFIAMTEDAGAQIVMANQPRHVQTLEAMVKAVPSAPAAYLTVRDTDDGGDVLTYRATCKAENRPAVIVTKHDRFASLRATIYNAALTDETKQRVFDYLLAGSLSGATVRASNREIVCSRLSFGLANEMAAWLVSELGNPHNIIVGMKDGREHSRLEAVKQNDGRVRMRQERVA
ncbi:MAG TPA: hypothetical protein VKA60_23400 [Blastocatellia bacterium]|nr:hypothetical protein [Blastocatellia bacterium]